MKNLLILTNEGNQLRAEYRAGFAKKSSGISNNASLTLPKFTSWVLSASTDHPSQVMTAYRAKRLNNWIG